MFDFITSLSEKWQSGRKLAVEATVDHVELTSYQMVLGLQIHWFNRSEDPLWVKDIVVKLYLQKRDKEPFRLYPLERFERLQTGPGFDKLPLSAFTLPANELYTERIRFISQQLLDIAPGVYRVEIEIKDRSDAIHLGKTEIQVESRRKYRKSEAWTNEE